MSFGLGVVAVGVLGLIVGSFLNTVAYRLPARIPLERANRCAHCDARIEWWHAVPVVSWIGLRGACASCRAPISVRLPLVEASTGIAFAAVTWWGLVVYPEIPTSPVRGGGSWPAGEGWALVLVVVGLLYFAAISIVLTVIDLDTHRLPNAIVLPSYLVAGGLLTGAALLAADGVALLRAVVGMAALYVAYFLLRLVQPSGMGGGDVKLAGLVGLYLGWIGWGALVVGAFAAFLYGGLFGLALVIARRAGRKTAIPFGPWMILGAWSGVLAGESLGGWYVALLHPA